MKIYSLKIAQWNEETELKELTFPPNLSRMTHPNNLLNLLD